jgi:hypothetical protein
MAVWAYACRRCGDPETLWYVSQMTVEQFPPTVGIVRVKVGSRWLCAELDRTQRLAVDGLLVREVIGTDAAGCADCSDQ